jgi:hypothetical protein
MTLALARETAPARAWVDLLAPAAEYAKQIAGTEFVPRAMRNNPAQITAAILYGDEIGLGPMVSLSGIVIVEGTPTLYAKTQRALVQAAGHSIWPEEMTATRVTWCGRRADEDQVTRVTWTMDDARRAGLAGRQTYRAYPRQMLSARSSAELVGAIFSDVVGGLRAVEEIGDEIDAAAAGAATGDPPVTRRRRSRAKGAGVAPMDPIGGIPRAALPLPPLPHEVDAAGVSGPPSPPAAPTPIDPEPAPDTPPDAPPPPASITDRQRRRMHALFRDRGVTERSARLQYTSAVLGRVVTSAAELSTADADALLDALEADRPTPEPPEPDPTDPERLPLSDGPAS